MKSMDENSLDIICFKIKKERDIERVWNKTVYIVGKIFQVKIYIEDRCVSRLIGNYELKIDLFALMKHENVSNFQFSICLNKYFVDLFTSDFKTIWLNFFGETSFEIDQKIFFKHQIKLNFSFLNENLNVDVLLEHFVQNFIEFHFLHFTMYEQ